MESRTPAKNKRAGGRPFEPGNHASPGRPKGSKNRASTLPVDDAYVAVQLARHGKSTAEIARMLDAKPEAVKDALTRSRRLLEMLAPQAAEDWATAMRVAADEGDHKPAMALLQSIEVVKPIAQTYDTGAQGGKAVAAVKVEFVNFGFAGLPQPQQAEAQPVIDVTARSTP